MVEVSQRMAAQDSEQSEESKQKEASRNVSLFFGFRSVGSVMVAYLGGWMLTIFTKQTGINPSFVNASAACPFSTSSALSPLRSVFAIFSACPLVIAAASFFLEEDRVVIETNELIAKTKKQVGLLAGFVLKPDIYMPILFILSYTMMPTCS